MKNEGMNSIVNSEGQLRGRMQFDSSSPHWHCPTGKIQGIRTQPKSELMLQHYVKITKKPLNCSSLSALTYLVAQGCIKALRIDQ